METTTARWLAAREEPFTLAPEPARNNSSNNSNNNSDNNNNKRGGGE